MGKNKKPFYQKIWVWVVLVVVVGGVGYGSYAFMDHNTTSHAVNKQSKTPAKQKSESTDNKESSKEQKKVSKNKETDTTKNQQDVASLSTVDKEALALLGLPDKFVSDYGALNADTILSGKSEVTSNAIYQNPDANNGTKLTSVEFSGVKIESDGPKNIVKLNNLANTVDNISYIQGYFVIDGDTITYKNQGTRVSGAQQLGTQSLKALFKQYKNDPKFENIKKLITDNTVDSIHNGSDSETVATDDSAKAMNVEQMKQGDFSSIAGTWQRPDGETMSINADGTLTTSDSSVTKKIDTSHATDDNGSTKFSVKEYPDTSVTGGAMFVVMSANTAFEGITPKAEDSILMGQNNMDELVYTRVK
ncbi:DUF6287 domain-containing protein [Weissella bombi]|uniref:DUF6287 domain-containing protein n=1 Tax=Weissella bombi TaxID=1505725 RepID=A0A1C3Z1Q0_9LACO|nr:DUF6287 domain-containing protein [Weissella bombi]SCB76220.1 hypothetical protein GA0061074_101256 [Weissella bombi]